MPCCDLRCFDAKYILLQFTDFCVEQIITPKSCPCSKNDKYVRMHPSTQYTWQYVTLLMHLQPGIRDTDRLIKMIRKYVKIITVQHPGDPQFPWPMVIDHHHHQLGLPQDHHGLHQGQRGVPLSGRPAVTTIRGHSPPSSCWPLATSHTFLIVFLYFSFLF